MRFCHVGTSTPYYVFITLFLHGTSLQQYYQSQPHPKNYIKEALDDSNTRQKCPEVEMWDKPPIKKDAPMCSLLWRSSQKASHEATNSIRLLMDEGGQNKTSDNMGPTRGQPSVSPHCWNQVHRIPRMSWYQNPKALEPMTLLNVWKVEKK